MDEHIIEKWNKKIKKDDIIYYLGDFSFKNPENYINRLNGKIKLILGNHDNKNILQSCFEYIYNGILELKIKEYYIILCHYPIEEWNRAFHGSLHFHGHVHDKKINIIKNRIDVRVDKNKFEPISFDECLLIKDDLNNG